MFSGKSNWVGSLILLMLTTTAGAQTASSGSATPGDTSLQPAPVRDLALDHPSPALNAATTSATLSIQPLLDFKESDIKFSLQAMMNTLRDNRHEGWVLAAYPDPKTSRP